MVYLYFEAIGKMLLYGGGIGILSYLLKKSERPTPIVGISILTAILGVSAASVFLPGPFFDIFRFASILLPLFFAALYLGLGIVMLREQPIEESTESRGASLATISGLLGIAGVIIYFIFLLEVVSFARPDTLLVGWHTADIIGIGFYLALLLSVLLAIPSVFATWHEWNMNTSKTGIILQLLLTLAFVLLALSLGSLLVVLLLARGELWSSGGYLASSWFLNIYWLSIEAIMLQMVALVRTLFILGIGAFGLGISLISFHLLSRNSRGRIAYLSGAFGIILLALTGILLTEPPAAFPGVFGLVSIAVLSLYGIVGGIVLTKKIYPSERIEDSVLEATQIEEGQSQ
ncbi:MAG: hypothetical protein EAX95_11025 [Candidatus Thorarchaeota archaeon]|nr:hypothetical protein [Candidatus Thorarchaeota archaeon]